MQRSINDKAPAFTAVTTEEVAARAAVMDIPLFPDLERELIKAFGAGSAIVLHQLVYWFGKPKMQQRRWLYKTFAEWREERGLGRKAVDTARRRLAKLGVLEEKLGPHKRVHYRIDWVRLAELLKLNVLPEENPDDFDGFDDFDVPEGPEESLHPKGDSNPNEDDVLGGESTHPKGDNESTHPKGVSGQCTLKGTDLTDPFRGQSNTGDYAGDYAGDYSQESSLLQSGADALSRATPRTKNEDFEDLEDSSSPQARTDKRHSQAGDTQPEKQAARDEVDEPPRVEESAPPVPENARILADLREVLDPDSGRWDRVYAELIRANHGSSGPYSPERLAANLAGEVNLPYAGRQDDLAQCLRYLFWEWSTETQARKVAA